MPAQRVLLPGGKRPADPARLPYRPYKEAGKYNHDPLRDRVLLAHKREIRKLEAETSVRGVTLIPLAIYFKDGMAKIEIGVAKGKQQHDKRATIREREQKRDLQRVMMRKG